jgi:hypothetical protein
MVMFSRSSAGCGAVAIGGSGWKCWSSLEELVSDGMDGQN